MIRFYAKVADLLAQTLPKELAQSLDLKALLERPPNVKQGDIAFPCFRLSKSMGKSPAEISQALATELQELAKQQGFTEVLAVGPYLNFRISGGSAISFVNEALTERENFGTSSIGKGKKVLIEYSSPNVAKPFHIGHFRNTMLGQSLCNIYRSCGYEVVAINHLGDWGTQFGKVAYAYNSWGNEKQLKESPISYLTELYVRFHQESEKNPDLDREARLLFKKIEDGDKASVSLWKKFVDYSIQDLQLTYDRLNVKFDHFLGESFYVDKIGDLIKLLEEKKLLELNQGAQVVQLEDFKMPPCLLVTGDGTTLYHTRDLAAALYRKEEFKFDRCLYVVGSEQALHFKQLFKVLELMEVPWHQDLEHIKYGLYRFKDGKLSTRKGKTVLLSEVVDDAVKKAIQLIEIKNPDLEDKAEVAEIIGLGAVIFNDLSTDRVKDVEFDWDRIIDFEGDTGPYIQYSYARASSILRKAEAAGHKIPTSYPEDKRQQLEESEHSVLLAKHLGRLRPTLQSAARQNKPSLVAHYALDLARVFNSFYRNVKVLEDTGDASGVAARLALVESARQALRSSLQRICMRVPEQM